MNMKADRHGNLYKAKGNWHDVAIPEEKIKKVKLSEVEMLQDVKIAHLEKENTFLRSVITSLIDTILDR